MNTSKRDYFGIKRDSKTYQELQLDFIKTMLAVVTNAQSLRNNKKIINKNN